MKECNNKNKKNHFLDEEIFVQMFKVHEKVRKAFHMSIEIIFER